MVEKYITGYVLHKRVDLAPLNLGEIRKAIEKLLDVKDYRNAKNSIAVPLGERSYIYLLVTGINSSWDGFTVYIDVYNEDVERFERKKGIRFVDFLEELENTLAEMLKKAAETKAVLSVLSKNSSATC